VTASRVAVVTDSSANLDAELLAGRQVSIVELQIVIDGVERRDDGEIDGAAVAAALRGTSSVMTSRPSPQSFSDEYARLAEAGAEAIVSVHLSAAVSGTYDSAVLAAREAPVPVEVVDSKALELALGFAVLAAADVAAAGGTAAEVARVARERASNSTSLFYVDTMEYLRRGGRVSAARAMIGAALAVKPLLHVRDGQIEVREKVRTSARARGRLEDLAVAAAGAEPVDVAVQHLADAVRADELAARLRTRIPKIDNLVVREVGAAVGAHVGPGLLAVIVSPV
jgi:DegV family protein with EDD domain